MRNLQEMSFASRKSAVSEPSLEGRYWQKVLKGHASCEQERIAWRACCAPKCRARSSLATAALDAHTYTDTRTLCSRVLVG